MTLDTPKERYKFGNQHEEDDACVIGEEGSGRRDATSDLFIGRDTTAMLLHQPSSPPSPLCRLGGLSDLNLGATWAQLGLLFGSHTH